MAQQPSDPGRSQREASREYRDFVGDRERRNVDRDYRREDPENPREQTQYQSQGGYWGQRPSLEWDDRYGRDFDAQPREGGRNAWAPGARKLGEQRSQFGDETYPRDRDRDAILGSEWSRTRGSGDWYGGRSQDSSQHFYGEGSYDEGYGPGSYDQGSPQSSRRAGQQGFERRSFAGKGPKGYQRSDERLKEIICEALMEASHIDASDISVEVENREVALTGTVPDRATKYATEELVERKASGCEVRNELRVKKQEWNITPRDDSEKTAGTQARRS